jgi:phosphopentomutase
MTPPHSAAEPNPAPCPRRAFVVVLDACGVGALPDAAAYGDAGTNTLAHLAEQAGGLRLPVLQRLGLGSIVPIEGVPPAEHPVLHGRLHAIGHGKDSTAGHWALMGIACPRPLPTYPDGFPPEVIALITEASGRQVICNRPYNGITVIEDFADEQLRSGALIVYTSQDSVLQIAAHEDVMATPELHDLCAIVRANLPEPHAIGRVIARPFRGGPGSFARTEGRKDLSLAPPGRSYLEAVHDAGVPVHAVGKAGPLLAGIGVDQQHPGATNATALANTGALIDTLERGLVFTNLVETDQLYGHRHDAAGFAGALEEIDAHAGRWLEAMRPDDMLILTADHGCDVTAPHTDHTREYVPLLASFAGHGSRRHDGPMADVGASVLRWFGGDDEPALPGTPFV